MTEKMPFSVILLAGDRETDPLAKISPSNRKALLALNDKPMLLYVLDALNASPSIGKIYIVANDVETISGSKEILSWLGKHAALDNVHFMAGAGGPAASVCAVLEKPYIHPPILIATADNPLLSSQTVEIFCSQSSNLDNADVAVGLATESGIRAEFPNARRTFIRLSNEGYSGCNLFAMLSKNAKKSAEIWQDVERRRKKPWQLISYFGILTLIKALMGRLDINAAFTAVSKSMQVSIRPIIIADPSAAMDVDREEHISLVEGILSKRDSQEKAVP